MKTLYLSESGRIGVDHDNNSVFELKSKREAIRYIMIADEDIHIVCNTSKGEKYEVDANKGDIIIYFYEDDFIHPVVVVNNANWVENITEYDTKQQNAKECWATPCCNECKCCD
jgi:formylmethanofuran dehydrogenase subunit D